jgi:hypothetical protein
MFSFFATVVSVAWIGQHLVEVGIALGAVIALIVFLSVRKKKRRAAYLALPVRFIGNTQTKTYHCTDCPHLAKVQQAHKIAFRLESEVDRFGYQPCGACHPRWPE